MSEQRKLAAILASDVVGYSKLAGSDEERTLARLRTLRSDLIDPTIAVHHGRVVKRTGDGSIVEFRSVVDAVRCAIEIQNGMIERNAGIPRERRIEFRVGIHVGDVVEESDGDLMGDGINIAARLEGIAKSGAICLSEDAYRQVRGRLDLTVSDWGATQLKNIAEPVRVYSLEMGNSTLSTRSTLSKRVLLGGGIVALIAIAAGAAWTFRGSLPLSVSAPQRTASAAADAAPPLSIVVLPFINLGGGDASQQYLADVLTEELTTGLARLPGFLVIARSTAFTYKGKPVDVKQVSKELGVRYALEGSEQHTGDKVRVNAQLIDAESGTHLWADQFDEDRSDLLQMQDDIVTRVAQSLHFELVTVDAARLTRSKGAHGTDDLSLRCHAAMLNSNARPDGLRAAASVCEQALRANDRDAFALSVISLNYSIGVLTARSDDRQVALVRADDLASRALALEPNNPLAHSAKSNVLLGRKLPEEAIAEGERSLTLDPSFTSSYTDLCVANNYLGRPDRCLELADRAIRISPRDPYLRTFYHMKGWALLMKQDYVQAIESLRLAIPNGAGPFTPMLLAAALALTDHTGEAHEALEQYLGYPGGTPGATIAQLRAFQMSFADNPAWIAYNERLFDGLRKAGMPDN